MTKYVALRESVYNGKLIAAGDLVVGEGLEKEYPALYRKATPAESLGGEAETVSGKTIEKIVAELKKQVLEDLKPEIAEIVKAAVAEANKVEATTESKKK